MDCLQSQEFPRVRIGVGRPAEGDAVDHVLGSFTREEREIFENAIPRAAEAVEVVLSDGVEVAMNRFNAASA